MYRFKLATKHLSDSYYYLIDHSHCHTHYIHHILFGQDKLELYQSSSFNCALKCKL